jgi:hypothetical protein
MAILNILRQFGMFYGHSVYFWSLGTFCPVLVYFIKKSLATLSKTSAISK